MSKLLENWLIITHTCILVRRNHSRLWVGSEDMVTMARRKRVCMGDQLQHYNINIRNFNNIGNNCII